MENLIDEKVYGYYMVNGGIKQIRMNIELNINTRFQKRSSKILHKNIVDENNCINESWRDLVVEINNILKKEDMELVNFNIDK